MKKKILTWIVGTALVLSIAGCGNAKQTDGQAASQAGQTTVGTSNNGDTANTTDDTGSVTDVIVAVEIGSNPLSYIDDNGDIVGYEVDVLKAVDELIPEYEFQLEIADGDATQVGLETGKYALIGGGLFKTAEREEKYLLPDAVCGVSTIRLFVRADDDSIQTLDDLVGKKVTPVSANGGIYNLLYSYNEEHPDAQITIEFSDGSLGTADRLQSISDGEYDALIIPDNLGILNTISDLGLNIKEVEQPVKVNGTYFALAQGQEDLRDKVNDALITLREDGTLSELNIKWYGEDKLAYYED